MTFLLPASAQNSSKRPLVLVSMGFGSSQQRVNEPMFNSRDYTGLVGSGGLSATRLSGRFAQSLQLNFASGGLEGLSVDVSSVQHRKLDVELSILYKLSSETGNLVEISAGGSLGFLYTQRNYNGFLNNNRSYETITAMSINGAIKLFLSPDHRDWELGNLIGIPFVAAIVQPSYGSESEGGSGDQSQSFGEYIKAADLVSFGSIVRIRNQVWLSKFFTNKQLKLCYHWDYYNINRLRTVVSSSHQLSLSFGIRF